MNNTFCRFLSGALSIGAAVVMAACSATSAALVPQSVSVPGNKAVAAPKSVLEGVYTEQQANRGKTTYKDHCESCHQADLRGFDCSPPLAGPSFYQRWNGLTVADIFFKTADSMPARAPGSLSKLEYADVISYVLKENGLPAGATELPADLERLKPIAIRENKAQ
jgi:mono/diheme cytochrome c family protein